MEGKILIPDPSFFLEFGAKISWSVLASRHGKTHRDTHSANITSLDYLGYSGSFYEFTPSIAASLMLRTVLRGPIPALCANTLSPMS